MILLEYVQVIVLAYRWLNKHTWFVVKNYLSYLKYYTREQAGIFFASGSIHLYFQVTVLRSNGPSEKMFTRVA